MQTTIGPIGFTIPVQTLSSSQEVNMTTADVMAWRNHLPLADLGNSAKKIYHAISDCNKVKLGIQERFEILELLRTPLQFICQSLRKHYINQTAALTKQQLSIVNLARTLQIEMANGYKLIVEELASNNSRALRDNILPIALKRIIHYFTYIIQREYQLYSLAPPNVWKELHLAYQYAEQNRLLEYVEKNQSSEKSLGNDYKHILLLAATNPYQWRQTEQDALYSATEMWAPLTTLLAGPPNAVAPGLLLIELNSDSPPLLSARGVIQTTPSCRVLDLNPILERLKKLLATIEPNELQARITHSTDPEYAVSPFVLHEIIQEWTTLTTRVDERVAQSKSIKVSIGLIATHYYLNKQRPFQPPISNKTEVELTSTLSAINIQEENAESTVANIEIDKTSSYPQAIEKSNAYSLYSCTLFDENANGYGLVWPSDNHPALQAGEVIGIEKELNGKKTYEVCKIQWLQHSKQNEFKTGVMRLAKTAKAGSVQLLKEGKSAGYFLRCLLLESNLLVPTLPFKRGNQVIVVLDDNSTPLEFELSQLIDATGSYKLFKVTAKEASLKESPPPTNPPSTPAKESAKGKEGEEDKFDSIWSNL